MRSTRTSVLFAGVATVALLAWSGSAAEACCKKKAHRTQVVYSCTHGGGGGCHGHGHGHAGTGYAHAGHGHGAIYGSGQGGYAAPGLVGGVGRIFRGGRANAAYGGGMDYAGYGQNTGWGGYGPGSAPVYGTNMGYGSPYGYGAPGGYGGYGGYGQGVGIGVGGMNVGGYGVGW